MSPGRPSEGFTFVEMRREFSRNSQSGFGLKEKVSKVIKRRMNFPAILKFVLLRFSFLETISIYRPSWLLYDCLAGLAVGFVQVSQGLAYGALAGVNAQSGLYVSIFAPFFYALFGGSKHLSLATTAVMSLLIKENTDLCIQKLMVNGSLIQDDIALLRSVRTEISTLFCFIVGIALLLMAILRCGFIVTYLTDSLVSGYICAAGYFVFTSQISPALGFRPDKSSGFGIFFQRWFNIFKGLKYSNPATVIVFVVTLVPLAIGRYLNKKYIKVIRFALPLEIMAIAIALIVCTTTDINDRYNISSIGEMCSGLPRPSPPSFKYVSCIGFGVINIVIVTIALNFSIVVRYAEKYDYKVSMNQELFAYGIIDIATSFFSCFPSCGAISRTAVGATNLQKTQLASIVSSVLLIIVVYALTKYLQSLPEAILAAVIIVNITPTLFQVTECIKFWRITKMEGIIWLASFWATLFLDVDSGLFLSIIISFFMNIIIIQRPKIKVLGRLCRKPSLFLDKKMFPEVEEIRFVKIILMESPLVSYNVQALKNRVMKECRYWRGHNSPGIFSIAHKILTKFEYSSDREDESMFQENEEFQWSVKYLILDCSMMFMIDSNGLQMLKELDKMTRTNGARLILCGLQDHLLRATNKTDFFDNFDEHFVFLTLLDAVDFAEIAVCEGD